LIHKEVYKLYTAEMKKNKVSF